MIEFDEETIKKNMEPKLIIGIACKVKDLPELLKQASKAYEETKMTQIIIKD